MDKTAQVLGEETADEAARRRKADVLRAMCAAHLRICAELPPEKRAFWEAVNVTFLRELNAVAMGADEVLS